MINITIILINTMIAQFQKYLVLTYIVKKGVFGDGEHETANHLFLHCRVISKVWTEVMRWLNFSFITHPNLFIHATCWMSEVRSKKLRRGAWLIWHAVVWVVQKMRNDRIFNEKVCGVDEMVEQVKVILWHWSLSGWFTVAAFGGGGSLCVADCLLVFLSLLVFCCFPLFCAELLFSQETLFFRISIKKTMSAMFGLCFE